MSPLLISALRRARRRRSPWVLSGLASAAFLAGIAVTGGMNLEQLQAQCQSGGATFAAYSAPGGSGTPGGGFTTTPDGWTRVGATIDPTYSGGAFQQYYNHGFSYAELGATPGYANYTFGGLIGKALGVRGDARGIPGGYPLLIRAVGSNSAGYRILKSDIGSGQAGDLHYVIDLHPAVAQAIGFSGKQDVEIKPAGSSAGVGTAMAPQQQCALAAFSGPGQYVNPFRSSMAGLVSQRIDMGVDYDDVPGAAILAIGRARIDAAGTGIGGGWSCSTGVNGGVYYQLLDGPDAGRHVYVTEDVVPAVSGGQVVSAGTTVARFDPGGSTPCIEIGWGSGTPWGTEAAALGQQSSGDPGNNQSFCGQSMSQLIASLGGKPGTANEPKSGTSCPVM